jgi:hypothetical protein
MIVFGSEWHSSVKRQASSGKRQPASGNRQPATGNQQPTTTPTPTPTHTHLDEKPTLFMKITLEKKLEKHSYNYNIESYP